jgi:hypothetical protein
MIRLPVPLKVRAVGVDPQHREVRPARRPPDRVPGDEDLAVGLERHRAPGVELPEVDPERALGVEAGVALAAGQQGLDGHIGGAVPRADDHHPAVRPQGDVECAVGPQVVDHPLAVGAEARVEIARHGGRHDGRDHQEEERDRDAGVVLSGTPG